MSYRNIYKYSTENMEPICGRDLHERKVFYSQSDSKPESEIFAMWQLPRQDNDYNGYIVTVTLN